MKPVSSVNLRRARNWASGFRVKLILKAMWALASIINDSRSLRNPMNELSILNFSIYFKKTKNDIPLKFNKSFSGDVK